MGLKFETQQVTETPRKWEEDKRCSVDLRSCLASLYVEVGYKDINHGPARA